MKRYKTTKAEKEKINLLTNLEAEKAFNITLLGLTQPVTLTQYSSYSNPKWFMKMPRT